PAPISTRFPYTTLFRSQTLTLGSITRTIRPGDVELLHPLLDIFPNLLARLRIDTIRADADKQMTPELAHPKLRGHSGRRKSLWRSEEHTSELQSRFDLV